MKLPAAIRCRTSAQKVFPRKSFKTRDRNHTLKHARLLTVIMDNLFEKYFNNPESFGKAMQLLMSHDIESEKAHNLYRIRKNIFMWVN